MIAPRPSSDNTTPKPGFPMQPFWGIDPVLMSNNVSMAENTRNEHNHRPLIWFLFMYSG